MTNEHYEKSRDYTRPRKTSPRTKEDPRWIYLLNKYLHETEYDAKV